MKEPVRESRKETPKETPKPVKVPTSASKVKPKTEPEIEIPSEETMPDLSEINLEGNEELPEETPPSEEETELSFDDVKKELESKGLLNVPLGDYSSKPEEISEPHEQEKNEVKEASKDGKTAQIKTTAPELEEYIKVSITKVNKLLNLVGEMVINKINSNEKLNILRRLVRSSRSVYKKMQDHTSFLLNNPRVSQMTNFNELKLSLHDITNDMIKIRDSSTTIFDDISIEISQLDPIIDELQLRMKQIRMLPIGHLFETMPRLVRDIAVAQGKKIELKISGEETELDKKVLETIKGSLIHLLRNSVDHGIELSEDREKNGKVAKGTIYLRAFHKGGNVVIEIEDDGRGINIDKVKETAVKRGLISLKEVAEINDQEALNFIFLPGFSTAPIITDISGRGVGLDVVKTDIKALKGNISIETKLGKGTKFSLQLPLTVAIIQALLVRSEDEIYAIPLLTIEESVCINKKEIASIENRYAIRLRNRTISIVKLRDILNIPVSSSKNHKSKDDNKTFIVIMNYMEKLLGIEVDEIIGEQEVFIKSLDENLGKLKNVSGATVLGNGQVIIILDVVDLFASSKTISYVSAAEGTSSSSKDYIGSQKKKILIVEDSLTTRELERSILQTHGYNVDTSIDGLDALSKLQNQTYDLIVSDVEMPKMDGFELCKAIRQNPDLKDVPFIVVTSLDREEDKRRGIEVGAQAYIVKRAFDQSALVDTIKRLIG